MVKGSIEKIESFGLVDGPGIRSVIFLSGCMLRCKYCHNPEMWHKKENNMTTAELWLKIKRFKAYYGKKGGVTFSGGEPLLQPEFLIEMGKILKQNNVNVALDTAGVGVGQYEEILKYVDLIIFDVKQISIDGYKDLTGVDMEESLKFLEVANRLQKHFWIRQVIVPGMMDNDEYIQGLSVYLKKYIARDLIDKIEFLPYHTMGKEKYNNLGLAYPLGDLEAMDNVKCEELYERFKKIYDNEREP